VSGVRRAGQAFALVALCWTLAACSWFGGSSGPKPAELPELPKDKDAPRVLWSASVGEAGAFAFAPALVGESLYAASRGGTVVRLNAASGKEQWRVELDARLSAGVGASERTVVVASDRGDVFALDAETGKPRWRSRISSEALATPRVGGGVVVARSADSRVYAFGEDDGKRRWVYQRASTSLMVRAPAGVTLHEGSAYAGFPGGKLVALALASGGPRWEATVALPKGTTELERVTDVVGDPAVVGREVCAAAYQGRVACFDAGNGNQLWARELSTVTGAAVDARYIFVSDERGAVHALDRSSGRSVWKQERLAHRQLTLPLPLGAAIALGDLEGYVHLLARETGAFEARAGTDGTPLRAAPLAVPGAFVVQTQGGTLYAFAR
jgi:outer membrane protein assembly factor BamB